VEVDEKPAVQPVVQPKPPARTRWLAVPLGVYAATRVVQLALIAWLLPPGGDATVRSKLLSWDTGWFLKVAQEGYPHGYTYDSSGALTANGLAFFPGYPFLVRAVHEVTRLSFEMSALTVSWLAGAAAVIGVYALGRRLYDDRVATALAVLFCAQPMSVVLSMAYSEGLFVALVCAALLAVHRRAWLLAGLAGLAASLTRPTGAALAIAIAAAAIVEMRRPERRVRAAAAAALALVGVPAYLAWVGERVGNWHAWFDIQTAGWGSTFDYGLGALEFVLGTLRTADGWVQVSVALMLIAAVVAAVIAVTQRVWPPLLGYGLIALALVLGQNGFYHSKPRLLVPVLVILVPAAVALGRARPRTATLVLVGYALFGLWYGAYLITVWRYAI
jgi:hypothetical protein